VDPVSVKPKLAMYANSFLLEAWLDSPQKDKIFIGSHNLDCSSSQRVDNYTDKRSRRHDGVNMYGYAGKTAYTESVINILMSSIQLLANDDNTGKLPNDDSHTRCPQTKLK
jgi:hypothetical protein